MASPLSSFDRRKARVRRTLRQAQGNRPRLSVFRSSKHIYAQIIDDTGGHTVAAASTIDGDLKGSLGKGSNVSRGRRSGSSSRSGPSRPG